jgi:hypothetical protein
MLKYIQNILITFWKSDSDKPRTDLSAGPE